MTLRSRRPGAADLPFSVLALFVALFLAVFALAPSRARAQTEAPGEQPGTFGEVIDVRVLNLEAVVTDRQGVRVSGLGPEDFVLEVDGREVPIEYFTEVSGGTAVTGGDEAARSTLPALAPGEAVGTSFLVYVDEYFALPNDRDRVLRDLREQLPHLDPEDRMAIVAFDGRKLEMLSTWSSNEEELSRVLRAAATRPAHGLQREMELRTFGSVRALDGDGLGAPIGPGSGYIDIEERHQIDLLAAQVERSVLAATSALRSFAQPPGRKVMLLLSGGWPFNPALWVVSDPARAIYSEPQRFGEELFRPLIETANRLGYTLYPVDVPGIGASGPSAAESGIARGGVTRTQVLDREQEEHTALTVLAEETGGQALIDGAVGEVFTRVVDDTRSYYWLGFTPDWRGDDTSHRIRLRARDPKLRVRTRESFSDLSRQSEVTMMVESALLFGNAPSAIPLHAELGEPQRAGIGKVAVPLRIAVPLHALTFLPVAEGLQAEVELRIAVLDEDGNTADVPVMPFGFQSKEPIAGEKWYPFATELKLRRRHHDVVVSLYDVASGTILSSKLEIDP